MTSRLAAFLTPQSVAIVGCPKDLTRPGARPLVFLQQHRYPGRIYPVNPRHTEIGGLPAFPSLAALPEKPDIAWIGVPTSEVDAVVDEVAQLGIRNAVVLTAGFAETDRKGRRRQTALRERAEAAGVTLLGPNMLGFINCWDRVPLTFSPAGELDLRPGPLGVASQSGALAGVVVNRAFDRGLGVSAMISTGNEAGITVSECLEYFADDPRTRAVALVAEGIRDGDRFRRAAARLLEAGKPIVALKVGRSPAGRRNALTHTGALAGSDEAWRAVARQLAITEVETFEDLIEVAGCFARGGGAAPRGVAVVTTSGGASIMTADQLEKRGIALPRFAPPTLAALGRLLPDYASTRDNPVDVTAGLSEPRFADILAAAAADPRVDAVVTAVTGARGLERAENVVRVAREAAKPFLVCWLGGSLTEEGVALLDRADVPCFRNPRALAIALAAKRDFAATRAAWRRRRPPATPRLGLPQDGRVGYAAVADLARRVGLPLAPAKLVRRPRDAEQAARRLGFPVAVKLVSPDVPHKTEAGALALGLTTARAVRDAASRLLRHARGVTVEGVLVQRMVSGLEVLVGVTRDPTFGPILVLGAGGVGVELAADATWRPLPVTRREIGTMLGEVRALRALAGFRGRPAADVPALIEAVLAVGRLGLGLGLGDRLVSLDVNPLVVGPRGVAAVDVLVAVKNFPPR